jgi:DNA-binding NtrC family response regulator
MVELEVPALKNRAEDIPLLADFFLRKFSREFSRDIEGLTPRASLVLARYGWPGNVRELEHVIGRTCMMADGGIIDVNDLPEQMVRKQEAAGAVMPDREACSPLAEQERRLVEQALRESKGNQSATARKLGIGRDALRYKLKQYDISSQGPRREPRHRDEAGPDQLALPGTRRS